MVAVKGHVMYSSLALVMLASWASGGSEPVEFTVKVFPITESTVKPEGDIAWFKRYSRSTTPIPHHSTTTLEPIPKRTTEPPPPSTTTYPPFINKLIRATTKSTSTAATTVLTPTTLRTTEKSTHKTNTSTSTTASTTTASTTTASTTRASPTTDSTTTDSTTTSSTTTATPTTATPTTAPTSTTTTTPPTTTTTSTPTTTVTTTATTTAIPTPEPTEDSGDCRPDPYCVGTVFPSEFYVAGHKVACDQTVRIQDQCCLSHGHHRVCYNIMVDGELLAFSPDRPSYSTDYMELCDLMLLSQNATSGPYSMISKKKGQGRLAYRYKAWVTLPPTKYMVKDIACMVKKERRRKLFVKLNKMKNKGHKDNKNTKYHAIDDKET